MRGCKGRVIHLRLELRQPLGQLGRHARRLRLRVAHALAQLAHEGELPLDVRVQLGDAVAQAGHVVLAEHLLRRGALRSAALQPCLRTRVDGGVGGGAVACAWRE